MISERQQIRLLNWFKRNIKEALILVLFAIAIAVGYGWFKTAKDATDFAKEVYRIEVERSKTWEKISQESKSR